jgi:hypothetical protein
MAKKTFVSGEVLYAADVNNYLMNQTVMVFASDAARGSAITSPTEGMVTYSSDVNNFSVYDGSSWLNFAGANTSYPNQSAITSGGYTRPVPFAMAVASASITGNGTINFPANRFSVTPTVLATVISGTSTRTSVTVGTITLSAGVYSIPVFVWTGASAATVAATVHIQGIQMTSASATG